MNAIGNTPLIKLSQFSQADCADVYVKWEGANPTGSMKDRMALSMIQGAEHRGELKSGGRVVEYTGGSTGSSLAMVCAMRGYRAHFVSSNGFSEEKLQTMRALGAEVEIVPAEGGVLTAEVINRMIARTQQLAREPGTFWPDQVNNLDNKLGYHAMGREILEQITHPSSSREREIPSRAMDILMASLFCTTATIREVKPQHEYRDHRWRDTALSAQTLR